MSILQNDVRGTSKYVNILIGSCSSASIIHDSFVPTNKYTTEKLQQISGPRWMG